LTIVKALKNVKDIPLVVVGRKTSYFEKVKAYIKEHKLEQRVLFLENVSNQELPVIYQLASIFIFPSLFEGFGIPIIEALTSKTPVITSKGGCFPEAAGPNSLYIEPSDEKDLAEKINHLLASEQTRTTMQRKDLNMHNNFTQKPLQSADSIIQVNQIA
jgi:glycosyltransferase involved in cell wall biosynthesis